MNEQEWLDCGEERPVGAVLRDGASQRKLTLFACACCRHIWALLVDERSRNTIEVLERFIDAQSSVAELMSAYGDHEACEGSYDFKQAWWAVCYAVVGALGHWNRDPRVQSFEAAGECVVAAGYVNVRADASEEVEEADFRIGADAERQFQRGLLRDIFGNPFRPAAIDPAWLTPKVQALAQSIYAERRFADLSLLAVALAEAGCTEADILAHCRQPGEHVRGCWVVDLLLGKK